MTESILCNTPVIVTDIGALGNRVAAKGCGWSISVDNAVEEFGALVKRICKDVSELNIKKQEICNNRFWTEAENAEKYYDIYTENLNDYSGSFDYEKIEIVYQ